MSYSSWLVHTVILTQTARWHARFLMGLRMRKNIFQRFNTCLFPKIAYELPQHHSQFNFVSDSSISMMHLSVGLKCSSMAHSRNQADSVCIRTPFKFSVWSRMGLGHRFGFSREKSSAAQAAKIKGKGVPVPPTLVNELTSDLGKCSAEAHQQQDLHSHHSPIFGCLLSLKCLHLIFQCQ